MARTRILHKLYLSALVPLVVVGAGMGAVTFAINLHDYVVVKSARACWSRAPQEATSADLARCGLELRTYGTRGSLHVLDAWNSGALFEQEERGWWMATSPLWLVPALVLALVRRWVLWLTRPEADPVSSSHG